MSSKNYNFNHPEAFCVMTYRCDQCKRDHFYWNSRDGVTPFMVSSPCCYGIGATHINFKNDTLMDECPALADWVFVDLTKEAARNYAIEAHQKTGPIPSNVNLEGLINQLTEDIYGDGRRPHVISRQDYFVSKDNN